MKCPYCDNEMIKGVVQSGRPFFFTTKPQSFWMWPNSLNDEFFLSSKNWIGPTCNANHCAKCKKVVLDYNEKVK